MKFIMRDLPSNVFKVHLCDIAVWVIQQRPRFIGTIFYKQSKKKKLWKTMRV